MENQDIEGKYKSLSTLEFYKILDLLQKEAICQCTKEMLCNLKPLFNYDDVISEIEKTNDAYKFMISFGAPKIEYLPNMSLIINRVKLSARLSMKELLIIGRLLQVVNNVIRWRKENKLSLTTLNNIFDQLIFVKDLSIKIRDTILSEEEMADDASENLFDIRGKKRRCSAKIRESLDKIIRSDVYRKYLQEPIVTIRDGRFVIPVKLEYKSLIKGLVHDSSISGSTIFIEPISVVEANNEIKILEDQEKIEIEKILDLLSAQVNFHINDIESSYKSLILVDLYFAKAKLGYKMKAVIPKINNVGKINLIKARHPLIDSVKVIPVDINLGYKFDSLVITGPNTGGKTITLKTVGLLTLMAMSGLMIPAEDGSELSVFNDVLVDIGDEQSIEQNLSTFSAHMVNIVSILDCANNSTLVLIDELGVGTDPIEGASLAVSILEDLKLKQSKIMVTTHYSEIKLYALQTDRVENASCEFDVITLKPTYKLLIGVPGKSNAFLIAQHIGLNNRIIDRARELINGEEQKFEDVISGLEAARSQVENQKIEICKLKKDIEEEKNNLIKLTSQINENKKNQIEQARKEAVKIVKEAKLQSKSILDELEHILSQKDNENFYKMAIDVTSKIKCQFKKLENITDPIIEKSVISVDSNKKIDVGDKVKILDMDQMGVIIGSKDQNGYCLVQIGIIKKKVHISNLSVIKLKKNQPKIGGSKYISSKTNIKVESEIDLRGMTVESAIIDLDKFIDNAVLIGISVVKIIHGKGTGVLRSAVTDYLRSNINIKHYRLGVYGEGEDGVTLATIK